RVLSAAVAVARLRVARRALRPATEDATGGAREASPHDRVRSTSAAGTRRLRSSAAGSAFDRGRARSTGEVDGREARLDARLLELFPTPACRGGDCDRTREAR